MSNIINKFEGEYRFLSNFWACNFEDDGLMYRSVEHFYQATKAKHPGDKIRISLLPRASEAKHEGQKIEVREDWNDVKLSVMEKGLRYKFLKGTGLAHQLLQTGDTILEEGNNWHDIFWGKCTCEKHKNTGENNLGKLLMKIREELREDRTTLYKQSIDIA